MFNSKLSRSILSVLGPEVTRCRRSFTINQYLDSQLDPDKRPAPVHYAAPSLNKVAKWLDRKQKEVDDRFYRRHQQLPEIYGAGQLRRIMVNYLDPWQRSLRSVGGGAGVLAVSWIGVRAHTAEAGGTIEIA